jgi:hypothetical protein
MSRALFSAVRPLALALTLACGTLAAAPLLDAVAFAQGSWRTHKDSKYGYRVEFPGVPAMSQETTPGGATMDIARLEAGTTGAFMVISVTGALDPKTALDSATSGALAVGGNQLVSKADLTVDGAPARDLVMRSTETGVTMNIRMVIQGANFHQVMAVGAADAPLEGAERFINSFRLTGTGVAPTPGTMAPVTD